MNFAIELSFIQGFCLGLEHLDMQEEDDCNIIAISLGLLRICFVY
jgi:hypothetical protein